MDHMLRICEITGLSPVELTEITGWCMGMIIVCVLVGNMISDFIGDVLYVLTCKIRLIFFKYHDKRWEGEGK